MDNKTLSFTDFIKSEEEPTISETNQNEIDEIEVQKEVVAAFAAEKTELQEKIERQDSDFLMLKKKYEDTARDLEVKKAEVFSLKSELEKITIEMKALSAQLAMNNESKEPPRNPNALALLDRDVELHDRFQGETRDHVLEVIKEAFLNAEKEGRLRRAQVLESVLLANELNGTLAEKRTYLKDLFSKNNNILNGNVLNELERQNIHYKQGETYLLTEEILKQNF